MERRCLEEPAEASSPGSEEGPATGCEAFGEERKMKPAGPRISFAHVPLPVAPPPSVGAAQPWRECLRPLSQPPAQHGGTPGVFSWTYCGTAASLWKAVGG